MSNAKKMCIKIKSEKHLKKVKKILGKLGYSPVLLTLKSKDVCYLKTFSSFQYSDFRFDSSVSDSGRVTLKQLKGMLNEN